MLVAQLSDQEGSSSSCTIYFTILQTAFYFTINKKSTATVQKGMNEGGYCLCPVSALPRHKIKLCAYFDDSNDLEVSTGPASIHHTAAV